MGCGGSKAAAPAAKAPGLLGTEVASGKPGSVTIHGVPASMNCMGAILLTTAAGCGKMETCMPMQDTNKPEFLKINPFHAVPALKDGDFCLAESSAVLRYVAETYAKDAYPTDPKQRGFIDWAMDRFSGAMNTDAVATIYPIFGYAEPPADAVAAGKKCTENLVQFGEIFLAKGKFVGGEKLSIADYKVAPFFFCYEHAALKEKGLVDCPDRIRQFNKDFAAACSAAGMLSSAGGFALKEVLDAKLGAAAPAPEPVKEEEKPAVVPAEEAPVTAAAEVVDASPQPVEVVTRPTKNCC